MICLEFFYFSLLEKDTLGSKDMIYEPFTHVRCDFFVRLLPEQFCLVLVLP